MGPLRRAGVGLAVVLAVALAALAGFFARRPLAERWLLAELRERGLAEASLAVTRVGPDVLEVRDVVIGNGADLAIDLVEARVTRESLFAGRLAALRVHGVRVRGAYGDAGLGFGALDSLLQDGGGAEAGVPLALPATSVTIEAGELALETPRGPLRASFAASGSEGEEGRIEAHAELEAQHPLLTAKGKLDAAGSVDDLAGTLALELGVGGELATGTRVSPTTLSVQVGLRARGGGLELDAEVPAFPFAVSLARAAGEELHVEGQSPALRVTGRGPDPARLAFHVESEGGRVELREPALELRDVVASLDVAGPGWLPVGGLGVERILDAASPARFAPLSLRGELRPDGDSLGFDLVLGDGAELVVEAKGRHDPRSGAGEARLRVAPLAFEPDGLQPAALLPLLGARLGDTTGTLEAVGDFSWQGGEVRGGLDVALRDVSSSSELADVERVNAALRVDWPLSTPPAQLLSLARLDPGLELTDGLVEFELRPDGVLDVGSASFEFAGGRISTSGELDPQAEERRLVLDVEDLDLGQLFALVRLEGLSGEGTLAGEIPVVVRGDALEIRGALLASDAAGGWIRYRPGAGAAGLAANPGMAIALRALENFAYERLEIRMSGAAAGSVRVVVALRGSNPDLEGGRPVEFNLDLEGELGDLVGAGVTSYRIPEEIERRLGEFGRRSR